MVTVRDQKGICGGRTAKEREKGVALYSFAGLASDPFPVGEYAGKVIANGSMYVTVDSGDQYIYDGENKRWSKSKGSGGGGGEDRQATDEEVDGVIGSLDDL